jgi:hypothetical protein
MTNPGQMSVTEIKAELASLTGTGWEIEQRKWRLQFELKFRKETSNEQSSGHVFAS